MQKIEFIEKKFYVVYKRQDTHKKNQRRTYRMKTSWELNGKYKTKYEYKLKRIKLSREGNMLYQLAGLCCLLVSLCCLLTIPSLAQAPENNGYVGDKPLETYIHDTVKGDLYYTIGSSYYSGKVYPGDVYTVSHNLNLPEGATVKLARLYNYWTWSAEGMTGRYPEMKLSFNGEELKSEKEYSDRKGWGIYDYPTGTWAYDVSAYVNSSGTFSTSIENTGPGVSYVCIGGVGLLVIYTAPDGKDIEYWINEGADMLNSQMDENGIPLYDTTPNQTVCEMLRPDLQLPIRNAALWTITQSGNWENNTLIVNEEMFPGICDGKPYPDLEIDKRDITDCLKAGENTILFQAIGDYVVPSGAFLVIEKDPLAEEVQASTKKASEKLEGTGNTPETAETETKKAPGFGFGFTLAFLTGRKLVSGSRKPENNIKNDQEEK